MRIAPRALVLLTLIATACTSDDAPAESPDAAPVPDAMITCDEADLLASLAAQPGIGDVAEAACDIDGARCISATLTLPIIPGDPAAGTFANRFHLVHRSCEAPTIVDTNGYSLYDGYFFEGELAEYFGTNWIDFEHRYQGGSTPADADWRWDGLTIANGAADVHQLLQVLRPFYAGRWVTTGASKGGATTLYHRQLYPADVDGSVPYVAPISIEREDRRYLPPLDVIGPTACHADLHAAVVSSLSTRRAALAPMVATQFSLSVEDSQLWIDYLTAWLEWGFWQYTGTSGCADVPAADATDAVVLQFLLEQNGFAGASDVPLDPDQRSSMALNYEWLTEQGFAVQVTDEINALMSAPLASMAEDFALGTTDPLPAYDATRSDAVIDWVQSSAAQDLVLIYGQWDPWSGGQVPDPAGDRTGKFVVPETGHWASISGLTEVDRASALALIGDMVGRPPAMERHARAASVEELRQRMTARKVAESARGFRRIGRHAP